MRKPIRGFTLVELEVIVSIIGVLTAIALPIYATYTIRSRITEGILALSQCRASISEIYEFSADGDLSPGENNWGCGEGGDTTQYISSISTGVNGVVTVVLSGIDAKVDGKAVEMIPKKLNDDFLNWNSDAPAHVDAWECRPDPVGPDPLDATYVPLNDSYVPSTCR